jgi:NodT family efflux transporter outer membrane factor (OMF) lipoprotein
MNSRRHAPALAVAGCTALLLAAGCTVGPDYEEPAYELPDAWENAAAEDLADSTDAPLVAWWSAFGDTLLDDLIVRAKMASPDLAAAVGRINEAAGYRRIAGGDRWPQFGLVGDWSRTEYSQNGSGGAIGAVGGDNPVNAWEFGLGASWEIDLFGRIRRSVEAANAQLEASVEDYRDVLVTLYAAVAATYVDVRAYQERLVYAQNNARSQQETLEVVQARLDAGLVPALDVAQAQSNLANTLSEIPLLETRLEIARNELAILLGMMPGTLDARLERDSGTIPAPSTELAVALPAELLRRRPDVRRSERELAAQTARIGVATADLYPSFSLSGNLVLQAATFGDLGSSDAVGWSLVPGLDWPLFTGGKIRGQIQVEEGRTDQALAGYRRTVLAALAEVENALVALRQEEMRREHLSAAVSASEESVQLVHTQYLSGLTDFQSYLDAQRSLTSQQDRFAESRGQVVNNLIQLNRALGGGWSLDDPVPVVNPPAPEPESTGETVAEEEVDP